MKTSPASLLLLAGLSARLGAAVPVKAGSWDADHESGRKAFSMKAAAPIGSTIDRTNWKVVCDSFQAGNECANAIDGSTSTFWHTAFDPTSPNVPHNITVDMGTSQTINGISSLPRQDGSTHGFIAQHTLYTSTDGINWGTPVALGNWYGDSTNKFSNFEPRAARYVRLVANTEVEGQPWTSIADFNVYRSAMAPTTGSGVWGPTLDFPIVPVAALINPLTGRIVVWSSFKYDDFNGSPGGYTLTAEFDPKTNLITNRRVDNTNHDMFCPGIAMDGTGTVVVTGGNTAPRTSLYDETSSAWIAAPDMQIARGYQGSAVGSDGRIFTIGGSWSGGTSIKPGEVYDPIAKTWTLLPNAKVEPMLTQDPQGLYRADNHVWLFGWKNQTLFQAGPSTAMNWYYTSGTGDVKPAGKRATVARTDPDSMCGNAVMYDAVAGKILTVGGSFAYQDQDSTANAHIITIGNAGTNATVAFAGLTGVANSKRIFANAVVLPSGDTFINGGQLHGVPFSDATPMLTPEIYSPSKNTFTNQRPNSIVRVYHSVSLLLPDGTVFTGGGGLCGSCTTNHFDAQVFTPPYLVNSNGTPKARPTIASVGASTVIPGATLTFTTGGAISSAALVRYGTVTHSLNTDQRRVPLVIKKTATNSYSAVLPSDSGILLPGYWMLFVINSSGVPSISATIQVTM